MSTGAARTVMAVASRATIEKRILRRELQSGSEE
jgi:hypothetical protein